MTILDEYKRAPLRNISITGLPNSNEMECLSPSILCTLWCVNEHSYQHRGKARKKAHEKYIQLGKRIPHFVRENVLELNIIFVKTCVYYLNLETS